MPRYAQLHSEALSQIARLEAELESAKRMIGAVERQKDDFRDFIREKHYVDEFVVWLAKRIGLSLDN